MPWLVLDVSETLFFRIEQRTRERISTNYIVNLSGNQTKTLVALIRIEVSCINYDFLDVLIVVWLHGFCMVEIVQSRLQSLFKFIPLAISTHVGSRQLASQKGYFSKTKYK